jgi:hypothetical protein
VNNPLDVKENDEHTRDFALPLGGLLLCFMVITANPGRITDNNLRQEGAIIGILQLLLSCQKSHQTRYTTANKRM